MKTGRLICFSGIDGSGKSSQILKIVDILQINQNQCKIVRCGAHVRFFTFLLYLIAKRMGIVPSYSDPKRYIHTSKYPDVYKSKFFCNVWPLAVFLDSCILELFRIKIPLLTHEFVFSDRYIYDVLVEIMTVTRKQNFCDTFIGNLFFKLSTPSLIFYFNIDENEAFKRKNDIPDLNFLITRKEMYNIVMSKIKVNYIDANEPLEKIHENIKNILTRQYQLELT